MTKVIETLGALSNTRYGKGISRGSVAIVEGGGKETGMRYWSQVDVEDGRGLGRAKVSRRRSPFNKRLVKPRYYPLSPCEATLRFGRMVVVGTWGSVKTRKIRSGKSPKS